VTGPKPCHVLLLTLSSFLNSTGSLSTRSSESDDELDDELSNGLLANGGGSESVDDAEDEVDSGAEVGMQAG
jgi:hypothetical protein